MAIKPDLGPMPHGQGMGRVWNQKRGHNLTKIASAAPVRQSLPALDRPKPVTVPFVPSRLVTTPVRASRAKGRHWAVILSFAIFVGMPMGGSAWYLWARAVDQYASTVAFSVRKEEAGSAVEFLGGVAGLSGSNSSDTDILYKFIQSQKLVAEINAEVDLRKMWAKAPGDPYFGYRGPGTIEDLVDHWGRMIQISYDSGTRLIEIRALAFAPEDARAISNAIFRRSSAMINALSDIARADAVRYARRDLDRAEDRLRRARAAVTEFRNRTQIVDPTVDLQAQAGLLGSLQAQLAAALIEVDLMKETTRENDPRLEQSARRIRVIEDRIATERRKMGFGDEAGQGSVFATLVGDYERLQVDLRFAEQSYTAALATHDGSLTEAQQQTRYLAAHILPTLAEKSLFPERWVLFGLISLFAFLIWSIGVLVLYSLKDRR